MLRQLLLAAVVLGHGPALAKRPAASAPSWVEPLRLAKEAERRGDRREAIAQYRVARERHRKALKARDEDAIQHELALPYQFDRGLELESESCRVDSDCVAIQDVCGGWKPINKTTVQWNRGKINGLRMRARCPDYVKDPSTPPARCVEELCALRAGQ